ncbi:hypothetical protein BGZ72_009188 [Mortierella alpina]|nr:hypothetical protein BGZ72_009188 [Mortierella alpina]
MVPRTPTLQALTLPEILFHIGCYLNGRQALTCSLVCSTWYINFAPIVWANLRLGRRSCYSPGYEYRRELEPRRRTINVLAKGFNASEQLDIIRNKASWLRSLSFDQRVSPQQFALGEGCNRLQAISISGPIPFNNVYTCEYQHSFDALIKQNRSTLTSLTVKYIPQFYRFQYKRGMPRWSPLLNCAEHTNLTELNLCCTIPSRHLKAFWKICEKLEKLSLNYVSFDYSRIPSQEQIQHNRKLARAERKKNAMISSILPPPKRFPYLRELRVFSLPCKRPERFLNLIIADCPRLESLDWTLESITIKTEHFSKHVVAGTWPFLDKIKLDACFSDFSQDQLCTILQHTAKPLKLYSLDGYFPPFEKTALNILKERHFSTLRDINLLLDDDEGLVQDVLASCTSLEVFSGVRLSAATVMEDKRPWGCLGLKELRISLEITQEPPNGSPEAVQEQRQKESRALYMQLARLKQLRSLLLDNEECRTCSVDKNSLPLRLEMGLEHLVAQTQLELICICEGQSMDRGDILWMVKHLRNLRMVAGRRLNVKKANTKAFKDKYLWDYELAKILNDHGIETPSSQYEQGYLDDMRHLLGKGWPETDDLLYAGEEPAPLEKTVQTSVEEEVQTMAPKETTGAVALEDTFQAAALEPFQAAALEPFQAVMPEKTIQEVILEDPVRQWSWRRRFKQWSLWRRFKQRTARRQSNQHD